VTTTLTIPTVETERLRLRAPCLDDLGPYAAFCGSERSKGVGGPYTPSQSFQRLAGLIGHWHLRGFGRWMVADRRTDEPLGVVGPMHPPEWPEPEIAWSVFETAEGRGIAREAAEAARRWVYDVLGWTTVVSCTSPDNARSIALARRMGAEPDGSFLHPAFGELLIWRHPGPEALA
jgi:ribosomal-protein-alanine N-acetyltransferase